MAHHHGCFEVLHLGEENARFSLLFILMVSYMLAGAGVFMTIEGANEVVERDRYYDLLKEFLEANPTVNTTELGELLDAHAEASSSGLLLGKRPRWDFAGAFYFVGTVISTIGRSSYRVTVISTNSRS